MRLLPSFFGLSSHICQETGFEHSVCDLTVALFELSAHHWKSEDPLVEQSPKAKLRQVTYRFQIL